MAKKLRKINLRTTSLTDNAASFVNESKDDLNIRKIFLTIRNTSTAVTIGERVSASVDELPVKQDAVTDSRAHILEANGAATGGTGAVAFTGGKASITFERGQLVLEPDEALFLNVQDLVGTPTVSINVNIFYED